MTIAASECAPYASSGVNKCFVVSPGVPPVVAGPPLPPCPHCCRARDPLCDSHCYCTCQVLQTRTVCANQHRWCTWDLVCLTWCPSSRLLTSSSSPLVPTASSAAPNSAWLCCRSTSSRFSWEMAAYVVWTCVCTAQGQPVTPPQGWG